MGFKVYDVITKTFKKIGKRFGRSLLPNKVSEGLLLFFYNGLRYDSLTFSLTHSLSYSLTHSYSLTNSLTNSLTHLLTHSLTYSLTHSLIHLLTYLLTHSFILKVSKGHNNISYNSIRANFIMVS